MTEYVEITPADNFDDKIRGSKQIVGNLFTEYELSSFKTSIEMLGHTLYLFPDTTVISVNELRNGVQVEWVNKSDFERTNYLSTIGLIFGKHTLKPSFEEIDEQSQEDIKRVVEGSIVDIYLTAINLKDKYIPEIEFYANEIDNMKANGMTDYIEYLVISKVSEDKYKTVCYWIVKHESGKTSRLHEELYITKAQYELIKDKAKM